MSVKNFEGPAVSLKGERTPPRPGKPCPAVTRVLQYIVVLAGGLVVPSMREKAWALQSYVRWCLNCWGPMDDRWWSCLVWAVARGWDSGCLRIRSRS